MELERRDFQPQILDCRFRYAIVGALPDFDNTLFQDSHYAIEAREAREERRPLNIAVTSNGRHGSDTIF